MITRVLVLVLVRVALRQALLEDLHQVDLVGGRYGRLGIQLDDVVAGVALGRDQVEQAARSAVAELRAVELVGRGALHGAFGLLAQAGVGVAQLGQAHVAW